MLPLAGKRIFYIEDDLKNRAIAQMILEQAGAEFGFERWGRGETIQAMLGFGRIDIILLDLMFPQGVTGYDIFERIKAIPDFAHIPIVAVSAADPSVEIARTRAKGFDGFIGKPIEIRTFASLILDAINKQPVWYTR